MFTPLVKMIYKVSINTILQRYKIWQKNICVTKALLDIHIFTYTFCIKKSLQYYMIKIE